MADTGRSCPHQKGWIVMPGTIQIMRTDRGFCFLRDTEGVEVFFLHSALASPDHFATLAVGVVVEFAAEAGPKGPRATKVTVVPEPCRSWGPSQSPMPHTQEVA
jgi:cold shock CspA family protein